MKLLSSFQLETQS